MVNVQLQDLFPMEDIFTTLTFCSNFYLGMVAWCGGHIPAPMNEIINMDIFSFIKQCKKVIRQNKKHKKIILDL